MIIVPSQRNILISWSGSDIFLKFVKKIKIISTLMYPRSKHLHYKRIEKKLRHGIISILI